MSQFLKPFDNFTNHDPPTTIDSWLKQQKHQQPRQTVLSYELTGKGVAYPLIMLSSLGHMSTEKVRLRAANLKNHPTMQNGNFPNIEANFLVLFESRYFFFVLLHFHH